MKNASFATLVLALAACAAPSAKAPTQMPVLENHSASETLAQTLPDLSAALASGELTSVDLTQAYLDRIAAIDNAGPRLQAVLALNPDAMAQAAASDARRADGQALGPLDGIPVLLKDNIETLDPMATTAGAYALADNITVRDSPLAANLRAGGAVILGKTNLSQWANFRSNNSMSGWSALGGQVRNPHMLDRNPCGSSSGSGAAAAASLAAGTVGTETNGSIICPSNVNGVVGFKPTVGLVASELIIPISPSQDTAGPMTKSVRGAAMMLDGMVGEDRGFANDLDAGSLEGTRIGVLNFARGSNPRIHDVFDAALVDLERAGAILVDIDTFDNSTEDFWGKALTVLEYEFKDSLNAYLAGLEGDVGVRTLADIIAFNETNSEKELYLFDQSLFVSSQARGALTDEAYITALNDVQTATRAGGIDKLLSDYDVSALVSPSGPVSPRTDPINGDVWPDWAGAGWMAAIAGYPHITVPMGDVRGVPIGLSIMGAKDDDAAILGYGYAYEQVSQKRLSPQYLPSAEARIDIREAMRSK